MRRIVALLVACEAGPQILVETAEGAHEGSGAEATAGMATAWVEDGSSGETGAPPGLLDIPDRTWTYRPRPEDGLCPDGCSDMNIAHNPSDGRFYLTGGNVSGGGGPQEVYSYEVASDMWRLVQPHCREDGGPQPSRPDRSGWAYDTSRALFWYVPTAHYGVGGCPDEVVGSVMQFDPAASAWAVTTGGKPPRILGASAPVHVFDAAEDRLIRLFWDGAWGSSVAHLDLQSLEWTELGVGDHEIRWDGEQVAADLDRRRLFVVSGGRIYRYDVDTLAVTDLGEAPEGPEDRHAITVWDAVHEVVLWPRADPDLTITLHMYDPKTATWETDPMDPPDGHIVAGNHAVFDPGQNVLMVLLMRGIFLYRYG